MPNKKLTVTLAQLNPVVGDIAGNFEKIRETYFDAEERGSDLVLTPELSLTGAPPGDLARDGDFLARAEDALGALRAATEGRGAALVVGLPLRGAGGGVHNAAVVLRNGGTVETVAKKRLNVSGAFDERRCFAPASGRVRPRPFAVNGANIGLFLGEDGWYTELWNQDIDAGMKRSSADLLVNLSAAAFAPGALERRRSDIAARHAAKTEIPFISLNMVGGQDEVVFDGGSFCIDRNGRHLLQLPQWEECVMDFRMHEAFAPGADDDIPDGREEIWRAMVLGLRDYVTKSGFTDVVLGLSGGMDSAAVAAIAGDALGAERVHCVRLPSKHTSGLSNRAAEEMSAIWGFPLDTLPIGPIVEATEAAVAPALPDLKKLTRENMQARARSFLLMTLANEKGWLLLSTGNKSEIAVGYSTLYGDMAGAYNPLKDVFKTTVYEVANWRNEHRPAGLRGPAGIVIPREIIDRPPSAELSPDQLDTDSLPPYSVLDAILRELVEKNVPASELAARGGFDPAVVSRVLRLLRTAEYKRRQSAPGPAISPCAFGLDRRLPMVNRFDPEKAKEFALPDTET